MLNNLEATIEKIILESAASMAKQIAQSVRRSLAEEIIGSGNAAAAPATPKRMGRPSGSKSKAAAAAPAPGKAPKAKRAKAKRGAMKKRLLGLLKAAPHGVDVSVLAKEVYGGDDKTLLVKCQGYLYNLARQKLVTHSGSTWQLIAG